jgi:hypothetical protein
MIVALVRLGHVFFGKNSGNERGGVFFRVFPVFSGVWLGLTYRRGCVWGFWIFRPDHHDVIPRAYMVLSQRTRGIGVVKF